MENELRVTKRVGKGSGVHIIRISREARLMGLRPGDIIEVTMKVIDRAGESDGAEE